MKTKNAAAFIIALSGTAVIGLAAAPKVVLDSIPTAAIVNISKIEHEDTVSVSGTIRKDMINNSASVQTYVLEQDISKVQLGQAAEITGEAFPDTVYYGTVDKISAVAVKLPSGKTAVEVTVGITEPDDALKHGYTASVKLHTSEPSVMTIVPYEAVDQDDNGEFVYLLENGRAYKRYVETGRELSEGIELKTSIGADERIITVDRITQNGSSVKFDDKKGEN